jgi:hypothetical protein
MIENLVYSFIVMNNSYSSCFGVTEFIYFFLLKLTGVLCHAGVALVGFYGPL